MVILYIIFPFRAFITFSGLGWDLTVFFIYSFIAILYITAYTRIMHVYT